jgi:SAM-dependent methyltransferase
MDTQTRHAVLPQPNRDELARQLFAKAFRQHLTHGVTAGNKAVYEAQAVPAFKATRGRLPQSREDARAALGATPYYQMWTALQRNCQQLMWDSVIDTIDRTLPQTIEAAETVAARRPAGGALTLDPAVEVPTYVSATDIHLMPGGYHQQVADGDVSQGALYDRGLYLYLGGAGGPLNDGLGWLLGKAIQADAPDLKPRRILDLGCGTGNPTLPFKQLWPEAEVVAIDVSAPMLRYAHARAESLGVPIHFTQANAERTAFPEGHFDLIVSCLFLHETSRSSLPRILGEAHRLLKPGGVMAHLDIPAADTSDLCQAVILEWEEYNNNENFARIYRDLDLAAVAEEGGWPKGAVRQLGIDLRSGVRTGNYESGGPMAWTYLLGRA